MSAAATASGVCQSSRPVAARLAMGCLVLALGASLTTCRLDKLINPAVADRLAVTPASLRDSAHLGSSVARTVTLRVTHADDASLRLTWNATKTAAWVTLSQATGGAPDSLVVSLHADTLSQVLHRDTIAFTSTLAPGDTVRVPVTFDILPPAPELSVSPTSRDDTAFAGSALPHAFAVRIANTGSVALSWTAATDTGWLTLSKVSGGAPPLDSSVVTLTPGSLAVGTHTGTVTITAPGAIGSPAVVTVRFTIKPCAEPGVVPDAVVTGSIALSDCGAPQRAGRQAKLYAVQATAGDTLSLRLTAAFDAYLVLTNGSGTSVLQENDECPGFVGTACITNFIVPATGRYLIEATTAAAGETGAFSLSVVRERTPTTPQGAGQFRKDSTVAIGVGGVTPEDTVVFKATVNDSNPGDSIRLDIELAPVGSAFSNTPSHQGSFVAAAPAGQTVAIRVPAPGGSALTENAGYHWQARTCDRTGRCSAWLGFGNPDPAADFFVNAVPETPAFGGAPNQFGPGGGAIPAGGGTGGSAGSSVTVTFKAVVTDPDPGDLISIEVEVKPNSTAFDGTSLTRGSGVASSATASVGVNFTVPLLLPDNYHWRARACDQTNRCGVWVPFGSSPDFHVP